MPSSAPTPTSVHEDVVHPHETHAASGAPPARVIAIAVDASAYSEYAFNWTIQNVVRPETDQIVLLNVRPLVSFPVAFEAVSAEALKQFEDLDAANRKESHDLLRAYGAKVPALKYNIRGVALRGDPRDEIAFKVEEIHADMLVVGSRGLGAIKRAFLGSVSDYLVRHLHLPVIVPRKSEDEEIKG
ncbi:hypothetical protein DFJ73DRAFT_824499 [Zopfochytrium polystomum]|nr:hypothetical protein DFJ73DRAFT_824499 [Zopfochytrium polystomum]